MTLYCIVIKCETYAHMLLLIYLEPTWEKTVRTNCPSAEFSLINHSTEIKMLVNLNS